MTRPNAQFKDLYSESDSERHPASETLRALQNPKNEGGTEGMQCTVCMTPFVEMYTQRTPSTRAAVPPVDVRETRAIAISHQFTLTRFELSL